MWDLFKHHTQSNQSYINKSQWLRKDDPALSRHSALGVMSEALAHNIVQYTDDSITLLGLLHKKEHERPWRWLWYRAVPPDRLSPAFTYRTNSTRTGKEDLIKSFCSTCDLWVSASGMCQSGTSCSRKQQTQEGTWHRARLETIKLNFAMFALDMGPRLHGLYE